MSLISDKEYEEIFKNIIYYTDLEGIEETEFYNEYRGKPYSGVGFAQSEGTEILSME